MKHTRILSTAAVALAALAAMTVSSGAWAQSAGTWQARIGAMNITPAVNSGSLSAPSLPGAQIAVSGSTQLAGGITYMVTDHIAVDVPLALPFTHNISGAGSIAGAGGLGSTKSLPASVFVEYRFMDANAKFRPYVGAGLTYAYFYNQTASNTLSALTGGTPANPTTMSIQSKFAPTILLGGVFSITPKWFLEGMVAKTFVSTRTTLSTGQTLDATLNPTTVALSVGYRF